MSAEVVVIALIGVAGLGAIVLLAFCVMAVNSLIDPPDWE